MNCITGKVFVQIPWKTTQNKSKMIATLLKVSKIRAKTAVFKKLIGVMKLYEAFHLVQNSGRKLKGVKGRDLKALWQLATETLLSF